MAETAPLRFRLLLLLLVLGFVLVVYSAVQKYRWLIFWVLSALPSVIPFPRRLVNTYQLQSIKSSVELDTGPTLVLPGTSIPLFVQ